MHLSIIITLCVLAYLFVPALVFFLPMVSLSVAKQWNKVNQGLAWVIAWLWPLAIPSALFVAAIFLIVDGINVIYTWRENRLDLLHARERQEKQRRYEIEHAAEITAQADRRKREEFAARHL